MTDRKWLARLRAHLEAQLLDGRTLGRVLHLAELIAGTCDWETMRSRPTMSYLTAQAQLCLRTVQRWTRYLEHTGWLTLLVHGATPRYAPDRLLPDSPNEAREWLLTIPETVIPVDNTVTPSLETTSLASTGAREGPEDRRCAPGSSSLAPPPRPGPARRCWPAGQVPRRRGEQLTACEMLHRGHMVLARLSARHLRSILRPWLGGLWAPASAGWAPADILHALDHLPRDGGQHEFAGRVRDPAGWLRHRMSFWADGGGQPLPPRSAELAARRHAELAELAELAARRPAGYTAAGRGRGTAPGPEIAALRAARNW